MYPGFKMYSVLDYVSMSFGLIVFKLCSKLIKGEQNSANTSLPHKELPIKIIFIFLANKSSFECCLFNNVPPW